MEIAGVYAVRVAWEREIAHFELRAHTADKLDG